MSRPTLKAGRAPSLPAFLSVFPEVGFEIGFVNVFAVILTGLAGMIVETALPFAFKAAAAFRISSSPGTVSIEVTAGSSFAAAEIGQFFGNLYRCHIGLFGEQLDSSSHQGYRVHIIQEVFRAFPVFLQAAALGCIGKAFNGSFLVACDDFR